MRHFSGSACPRWTQYETLPTRIVPPPAIKEGLLAILHDRLYQACTYYITLGYIDTVGLKNIEYIYKAYHPLGGNGTGTELYNRAKALPLKED